MCLWIRSFSLVSCERFGWLQSNQRKFTTCSAAPLSWLQPEHQQGTLGTFRKELSKSFAEVLDDSWLRFYLFALDLGLAM